MVQWRGGTHRGASPTLNNLSFHEYSKFQVVKITKMKALFYLKKGAFSDFLVMNQFYFLKI